MDYFSGASGGAESSLKTSASAAPELKDKAKRAGFEVVWVTSFVALWLPLSMLSRFKERFDSKEFDPAARLNINPLMNATLERIPGLERSMIGAGRSFPVGGSLLLVARRKQALIMRFRSRGPIPFALHSWFPLVSDEHSWAG